jgi:hypothetical protein
MAEDADRTAYHKALYAKSAAHRLARINHTRRREGRAEITSLDQAKLRIPIGHE